jgi:hypothetical protein
MPSTAVKTSSANSDGRSGTCGGPTAKGLWSIAEQRKPVSEATNGKTHFMPRAQVVWTYVFLSLCEQFPLLSREHEIVGGNGLSDAEASTVRSDR